MFTCIRLADKEGALSGTLEWTAPRGKGWGSHSASHDPIKPKVTALQKQQHLHFVEVSKN
ncbi:hypothetical protein E2562_037793 [Oryza meyeriana var. granulata]|uniref:Uncharacterized protein n=1 Tax=Oryza meyeriana var. granulata TaxID=110450 RepID=A0A6G1E768_9ORYZ|nr:hypothetical protein E2562_037793 [Oryza meyeriana var. granulata]